MLQVINNTSDPTNPEFGYWLETNGLIVGGPYATREQAERAMPFIRYVLDRYAELEVKGYATFQSPITY